MKRAVVLVSGGLDSATCLGIAIEQGFEPVAVSFRYGQRHELELEAALLHRAAIHKPAVPVDLALGVGVGVG